MMLHCPACGELSEFLVQTRYIYDSETGPSEEQYAVCPSCLTAVDADDLDRQAELEKEDERHGGHERTGGND